MGFNFAGVVKQAEQSLAAKQVASGQGRGPAPKNPAGTYYVENQGQTIGPFQTQEHAQRRLQTETKRWKAAGSKHKQPELTMHPRGNKARARFPSGKPVPRLSPSRQKSAEDDQWDYRTNQPFSSNTQAQNRKGL